MVPVVAIVRGTRKAVDRLDDATTDHEDPTAQAAFEERRGQKRIVQKAPGILANIYKRIFGGKKSTQPAGKVPEGDTAPPAVPLSAAQQPAVAAA